MKMNIERAVARVAGADAETLAVAIGALYPAHVAAGATVQWHAIADAGPDRVSFVIGWHLPYPDPFGLAARTAIDIRAVARAVADEYARLQRVAAYRAREAEHAADLASGDWDPALAGPDALDADYIATPGPAPADDLPDPAIGGTYSRP